MEVDAPEQKVVASDIKKPVEEKKKKKRNRRGKRYDSNASVEEKKLAIRTRGKLRPGHRTHEDLAQSIVHIGHLPKGFEEEQMTGFFSQFGRVEKIKLVRSRRTGKSCGFGHIQFEYPEIAKVVADTMNNYLVKDKLLKCHVIPPSHFSTKLFQTPKFTSKVRGNTKKAFLRKQHDSVKFPDDVHALRVKVYEKLAAKKEELSKLGIELNEADVLDPTEKAPELLKMKNPRQEVKVEKKKPGQEAEAEEKKPVTQGKPSKKEKRMTAEKEEEDAILFALENVPGCKKLLSKLSETAKKAFVVPEGKVGKDESDDEMDTTQSSYKGNEVRIFGEDSEIELKTPPGMKKRNMKSTEAEEDSDSDFDLGLSDSGDEGFDDTVVESKTPQKSAKKSPGASGKKIGLKIFKSAGSTGKKKNEVGLTRREELRRLNNKKRKSAPAGDALVSKTFKNTAFLDRSLNRKRISKRADEIDSE